MLPVDQKNLFMWEIPAKPIIQTKKYAWTPSCPQKTPQCSGTKIEDLARVDGFPSPIVHGRINRPSEISSENSRCLP